tara:strand:+ start:1250 stop:1402 length:153 start_codon:yes stop_codon:yes gene_type:complete
MEEIKKTKSYYQKNKELYKRGGKYYKYVPVYERTKTEIKIKHGKFIISFN